MQHNMLGIRTGQPSPDEAPKQFEQVSKACVCLCVSRLLDRSVDWSRYQWLRVCTAKYSKTQCVVPCCAVRTPARLCLDGDRIGVSYARAWHRHRQCICRPYTSVCVRAYLCLQMGSGEDETRLNRRVLCKYAHNTVTVSLDHSTATHRNAPQRTAPPTASLSSSSTVRRAATYLQPRMSHLSYPRIHVPIPPCPVLPRPALHLLHPAGPHASKVS
jgi:hypothetical protein